MLGHEVKHPTHCVRYVAEPNRTTHGTQDSRRPLKPIIKPSENQGKIHYRPNQHQHHHQQQPVMAHKPDNYRNAKEQLMYTNKNKAPTETVVRDSPRTVAMAETEYRYRMRGFAK